MTRPQAHVRHANLVVASRKQKGKPLMDNKVKALAATAMAVAGVAGTAGAAQASTPSTAGTHTTTKPSVKTFKPSIASASGCNQDVCISIIGNGQHVSYWFTWASTTRANRATEPHYWVAGKVAFSGNVYTGTHSFYSSLGLTNYNFPKANVQVCNTWTGIPGKPCETIK
jgi:hypothetical protein